MTIIEINRVCKQESAEAFVNAIHGKSYMKFEVIVAPYRGQWVVSVCTDYTDDKEEVQDMLNMMMFNAIK